ncbi:MAG: 50S ribosomal protein L32 [Desulfohalobiaceae bacterium]
MITCECGEPSLPHRICSSCGKYAGQQLLGSLDEQK